MDRRNFIKTAGLTAAAIGAAPSFLTAQASLRNGIIKPPRLKEGDLIGLISPAGFIDEEEYNESVESIEALGFQVQPGNYVLNKKGYFAGSDEERAEDVNMMFANKEVKGIITARGGYGCSRILDHLDYDLIKSNPKPLIGYSDITALHMALFLKTGLISFHGPVGISTFNDFSVAAFRDVVMNPSPEYSYINAETDEDDASEYDHYTIHRGTAEGRLVGGNLSVVVSLIGTDYDIDTRGRIIFLEEVSEEPYRVDRMLTQMRMAGKFDEAAGVALGVFRKCQPKSSSSGITNSFSLPEVLENRLGDLGIPVVYGFSFGHIRNKFTLPFGALAGLDGENKILTLLEPAVN